MEITIKLDPEHARQLAAIQQYTNQDLDTVIQQGIGLYHQQLQPHYQLRLDLDRKYALVCNVSTNALAENN
jgi:hypothetical protein